MTTNAQCKPFSYYDVPTPRTLENLIDMYESYRVEDQVYAHNIRFDYYSPEDTFEETLIF